MMKIKLPVASVFLSFLSFFGYPNSSQAYDEMTFEKYIPCSGTAAYCRTRIMARGYITDSTPANFKNYLKTEYGLRNSYKGLTVCLDSPGGSVRGGVEIGRFFRSHKIATCVSDEYWSFRYKPEEGGAVDHPWIEDPMCASACTLAFLGGTGREAIGDNGLVGVHQFQSEAGTESSAQTGMALIGIYIDELGFSRSLLDIAALTPPDEMTWLTREDLVSLGVISSNDSIYDADWDLVHNEDGDFFVKIYQEEAWDREITKRVSLLAYIYSNMGVPTLTVSIFSKYRSPEVEQRLRGAYLENDYFGPSGPTLRLEVNDARYEYKNAGWVSSHDGAILSTIVLPSIFSIAPEQIHKLHIYADLPNNFSDVRMDSYLLPSEYSTYIRAALR